MKIKNTLLLCVATAILSGCASMKVTSESTDGYDFSAVKTFQWIDGPADLLQEEGAYTNEKMQQALNSELSATGWREVAKVEDANVQVAYCIKFKEHLAYASTDTRAREFSGGFSFNRDSNNWGYAEREPDLEVYAVEVGTLTVLMYDAQTGQRIWRGTLKTKIDRSLSIEKQKRLFRKVSGKLVSRIP